MSFNIIGDSGCDYTESYDRLSWLTRVPLTIELDGKRYTDDAALDRAELLSAIARSGNVPKTSCPSPDDYLQAFDCDADDIYVVTLSGELSGSYNSAVLAAGIAKEQFPEKHIHVFNSRSAAGGETAIALKIYNLACSGLSFNEVAEKSEKFIEKLTTVFVLEDLDPLRKNGRLTHVQAIVTAALRIKLVLNATAQGTIAITSKALTTQRAFRAMVEYVKDKFRLSEAAERVLVITQCNCLDTAHKVRDMILKECRFVESVICTAGGISTVYAADGGIVVGF